VIPLCLSSPVSGCVAVSLCQFPQIRIRLGVYIRQLSFGLAPQSLKLFCTPQMLSLRPTRRNVPYWSPSTHFSIFFDSMHLRETNVLSYLVPDPCASIDFSCPFLEHYSSSSDQFFFVFSFLQLLACLVFFFSRCARNSFAVFLSMSTPSVFGCRS